jgi:ElaB/YqjD/DUF883 family membrane-anchored ribosome-binding protein
MTVDVFEDVAGTTIDARASSGAPLRAPLMDQVRGGAQNLYGKARLQFRDLAEDAPYLARQTGDRLRGAAKRGARVADDGVRDHPFLIAAVAGVSGYLLSRLIHGRRL